MKQYSRTIIFTDLEGTILRESDGQFDKEELFLFFEELKKLQNTLKSTVNIQIVSPIYPKDMEEILKRTDIYIREFNNTHKSQENKEYGLLDNITIGACCDDFDEMSLAGDKRIVPLPNSRGMTRKGTGLEVKYEHVKRWLPMLESRFSIENVIYIGNGRNDFIAMRYVNSLKNGITMCPQNSKTQVKEIAKYKSTDFDLAGVIDCMEQFNKDVVKEQNKKDMQLEGRD